MLKPLAWIGVLDAKTRNLPLFGVFPGFSGFPRGVGFATLVTLGEPPDWIGVGNPENPENGPLLDHFFDHF